MSEGGIGAFGPVVFRSSADLIRTFTQLQESRRARYATHDVLSLEQKLQFLGLGLATVSLSMEFHIAFCRPQDELRALQGVLEGHTAYPVVIGGTNLGKFVLEDFRDTWNHVSNKGELLHAEAECALKEYR